MIYNGYLQVFTMEGPQCEENVYNTIKIIPLSTSLAHPLFLVYSGGDSTKLIYSEVNGILIDNYLALKPTLHL